MKTIRKIRTQVRPTTLREKELVHKYVQIMRKKEDRYRRLERYNQRLYAQYTATHDALLTIIKSLPDDPSHPGSRAEEVRTMCENLMSPYHPLK